MPYLAAEKSTELVSITDDHPVSLKFYCILFGQKQVSETITLCARQARILLATGTYFISFWSKKVF